MHTETCHLRTLLALLAAGAGLAACGAGDEPTAQTARTPGPGWAAPVAAETGESAESAGGVNRAPEIMDFGLVPHAPAPGEPVRAQIEALDADGDPIQFEYHWSLNGRGIPGGGNELSASSGHRGDLLSLRVVARDGRGGVATETTQVELANRAPRLVGLRIDPPGQVRAGRDIVAFPLAEDRDDDSIEFEFTWTVNGRTLSDSEAVLSTAHLRRGDAISVSVTASDGYDRSPSLSSPPIQLVNAPPWVAHEPIVSSLEGSFRHTVRAEDPDGDRLRYRLETGPEGMGVEPLLGVVAWTPTHDQAGVHPVRIEIVDGHGGNAVLAFELTVGDPPSQAPAAPRP